MAKEHQAVGETDNFGLLLAGAMAVYIGKRFVDHAIEQLQPPYADPEVAIPSLFRSIKRSLDVTPGESVQSVSLAESRGRTLNMDLYQADRTPYLASVLSTEQLDIKQHVTASLTLGEHFNGELELINMDGSMPRCRLGDLLGLEAQSAARRLVNAYRMIDSFQHLHGKLNVSASLGPVALN